MENVRKFSRKTSKQPIKNFFLNLKKSSKFSFFKNSTCKVRVTSFRISKLTTEKVERGLVFGQLFHRGRCTSISIMKEISCLKFQHKVFTLKYDQFERDQSAEVISSRKAENVHSLNLGMVQIKACLKQEICKLSFPALMKAYVGMHSSSNV